VGETPDAQRQLDQHEACVQRCGVRGDEMSEEVDWASHPAWLVLTGRCQHLLGKGSGKHVRLHCNAASTNHSTPSVT